MAFTKYASLEVSQILDIKGASDRSRKASLDKLSDFDDYRTEDGYLYARIRAISSRVNKNNDGWPSVELAGSEDVFKHHQASEGGFVVEANKDAQYGYSTFVGKPIFVDHNNSNPERARGIIVDAKLHVEDHKTAALDPYYASAPDNHMPPTWVELLLEVDAKSFPKLAKAIIEGSKDASKGIDGFSMGCDVEKSVCNICKNAATAPDEYCEHIRMKGATFNYINTKTGKKESKRSYEDCYGIKFFEISAVFDPADETALLRELVHKEAAGPNLNFDPRSNEVPDMLMKMPHPNELSHSGIVEECPECGNQNTTFNDVHTPEGPVNWQRTCENCGEVFHPFLKGGALTPRLIGEPCPDCFGQGFKGPEMHDCPTCGGMGSLQGSAGALPQGEGYRTPHIIEPSDVNVDMGMHQTQLRNPMYGHIKTADNPPPQSELIHAPQEIDTLREEKVCPVCGSTMEDEACDICGYIQPPEGFDNPDLDKAKEMQQEITQDQAVGQDTVVQNADNNPGQLQNTPPPSNAQPLSHINREIGWTAKLDPKLTGRINTIETPIKPGNGPVSDEPQETIISDETAPVTSSVRTAEQILTAVGRNKENLMSNRVAADPAPGAENNSDVTMDHDHKRVDVTGVGGVDEASNEEASKADAQIDLEGRGGTPVTDVASDSSEGLPTAGKDGEDAGFNTDKNIEAIPTKTFPDTGQHDPVSSDPFPARDEGVKSSGWKIHALDSGPYPSEDGGLGGGSTTNGVSPADPVGNAEDRVDVLDSTTSPSNNSGPTKTWNGPGGNGVLKQQEPVTTEVFAPWSSHVVASLKLADLEVEMGLIQSESKYERLAELQESSLDEVTAQLTTLERVKTAGLIKKEAKGGRLPSLTQPPAHARQASTDEDPLLGTLFGV